MGEELRHILARVLNSDDLHDPDLAGANLTVTEVRMSPDLSHATVFVAPLGGARDMAPLLKALRRATPFLRGQVARQIDLRIVPDLGFLADTSFDEAQRIASLLNDPRVARDLGVADDSDGDDSDGDAADSAEGEWEDEDPPQDSPQDPLPSGPGGRRG